MKGNDKTNEDTTGPIRIASISHSFLLPGFKCRFVRKTVLTEKTLLMHPDHEWQIISKLVSQPGLQKLQRIESTLILYGSQHKGAPNLGQLQILRNHVCQQL
jgi:hypothetical protein